MVKSLFEFLNLNSSLWDFPIWPNLRPGLVRSKVRSIERFQLVEVTKLNSSSFNSHSFWYVRRFRRDWLFFKLKYIFKMTQYCTDLPKLDLLTVHFGSRWKWTVLGESGRSKRLKMDRLGWKWTVRRKWTVHLKVDGPSESGRSIWKWTVHLKMDGPSENGRSIRKWTILG